MTTHTARVQFYSHIVLVTFSGQEIANNDVQTLTLSINCNQLNWQLSALSQVLNSFLSSFSTLESLEIVVYREDSVDVANFIY